MELSKLTYLKEGKSKKIFTDGNYVYLEFKGDIRCSNHPEQFDNEIAAIRAKTSYLIFKKLSQQFNSISFLEFIHPNILKMEMLTPLPLEVIPRYVAAGAVVKRFGFSEGYIFSKPILKIDYKTAEDDYLITDDLLLEKNIITPKQLEEMKYDSLNIANYLRNLFFNKGTNLWDFKMEFGITSNGSIKLIDEISFDGMRLKSLKTGEALDKDVYRETGDVSKVKAAYRKAFELLFEGDQL